MSSIVSCSSQSLLSLRIIFSLPPICCFLSACAPPLASSPGNSQFLMFHAKKKCFLHGTLKLGVAWGRGCATLVRTSGNSAAPLASQCMAMVCTCVEYIITFLKHDSIRTYIHTYIHTWLSTTEMSARLILAPLELSTIMQNSWHTWVTQAYYKSLQDIMQAVMKPKTWTQARNRITTIHRQLYIIIPKHQILQCLFGI